jgi:Domain of unknown function (DUF222)
VTADSDPPGADRPAGQPAPGGHGSGGPGAGGPGPDAAGPDARGPDAQQSSEGGSPVPGGRGAGGQRPRRAEGGRPGSDPEVGAAGTLPAGPGLAAWLSGLDPAAASGRDLITMAAAFRRVAAWAQAGELAAVAEVAARSAADDPRAGLRPDGSPACVTDDAAAQVSLGLTLSHYGAEAWAALSVALRWRLPRTAAALATGQIDLLRARLLAEAVIPLTDEAARAVEDAVLPRAAGLTYTQLSAAVRRAVIAADPDGAEHRRQSAERRAKVSLYPDQDCTATLTGTRLPAAQAAAAMARLSAMARALRASGAGGGLDLLRAQIYIGLLLGTMPPIPPPADGPPDTDAPDTDPPAGGPPGTDPPADAPGPWPDAPAPGDADMPEDDGYRDKALPVPGGYADWDPDRGDPLDDDFSISSDPVPAWPRVPPVVPAGIASPGRADRDSGGRDAGLRDAGGQDTGGRDAAGQDTAGRPPAGGLLDLTLPWATLTGEFDRPGVLGRIGPVTAQQARDLVRLAVRDYRTEWRVILSDAAGHATAVGRVPRLRPPPEYASPGVTSVVGRVTVVVPAAGLHRLAAAAGMARVAGTAGGPVGRMLADLAAAGTRALVKARVIAEADRGVAGGCAHTTASAAYRPPPRLREHVIARDQTCRYPLCGQPAWRGDLDHTHPWEAGGKTCRCNLGGLCRRHHRLKQLAGWQLSQPQPGAFRWVTPAGLAYQVQPDLQVC